MNCILPWLVIGDFNEIFHPTKRKDCHFLQARAFSFSNVLDFCDLVDVHTMGDEFTWHRTCNGSKHMAKRLDRVVGNLLWRLNFQDV